MKTRDKRLFAKELVLLFFVLMVLAAGVPTFAQGQDSSKQKADLADLSLQELMNIEVVSTATLTKTTPRLVPAAMTTVTAEQIQASGARSLNELLDIYVPNLQLIRHHWEGDHIGLRGIYGDNKYLLLVNGRVMNERTHLGVVSERDLVMLSDIHHIDVVRGPGSALYGPGAVSMVINIITYGPDTFQGTEVTTRLGAVEEFYSTELKHGQKFDDNDGGVFMYAGIGKYVGASKYDAPQIFPFTFPSDSDYWWWDPAWGPTNDPAHLPADGTKAGHPMTGEPMNRDGEDARNLPELKLYTQVKKDNWDIWARYTRGGKQFNYAPGLWARYQWGYSDWVFYEGDGVTPKDVRTNFYSYQQAVGYIGYKQELADTLDVDYAFSYSLFDFVEYRQNAIDDAYREDEYYGKILSRWQPNDQHKIAFGGEVSHRELGIQCLGWPFSNPVSQRLNPMPRWSTDMYSLLGEHQWNINDKWTTFIGARLDEHTYTTWMFSPRAAIVHSPNDKDTFKLMWSRSVRATTEEEMKAKARSSDPNVCGKSDPEKLDSIELRYERQQSKNLDLAASCFVHYNLELVDWSQSDRATAPVGTQRDYGLEFEASYHTDKTRVTVSHSYTKLYGFSLTDPSTVTYVTAAPYGYGKDLAAWSNHITKIVLQHKLDDKWTFDASLRIYWGFPGMKDYDKYYPYSMPDAEPGAKTDTFGNPTPAFPIIEDGWEKAYRGNYYLNLGLQYQPSKDLTIGVMGYNLLGIFNKDFNKRNYWASNGDYRNQAPAVGVSLTYKF